MRSAITEIDTSIRERIPRKEWRARQQTHRDTISRLLGDYLERRSQQQKDPVADFLFEYYTFRPSHLMRWSPGAGRLLEEVNFEQPEIDFEELVFSETGAFLDPGLFPEHRRESARWMLAILEKSAVREPAFGCFGMHEWAMVYRAGEIRHSQLPLRMPREELAEFVESRPLQCTHFDAFRFFSEKARPLNKYELSRERFAGMEQPGCIHTNMDLYKWAYKIYPWVSGETLRATFELALEARFIDMRASPYDLSGRGLTPIKIETPEGRLEYLEEQKTIYRKAGPVRSQLIEEYRYLIRQWDR